MPSATAVSAPGKVFLAGGYLVLDRAYTALVFGLSARIHVLVQDIPTSDGVELSEIVVESPQFREARWHYGFAKMLDGGGVDVTQLNVNNSIPLSKNPFVETALLYALTYITTLLPSTPLKPTKITILADNDYYSHGPSADPAPSTTSSSTHQFTDFGVRLQDAHKTGLGSSAALVTAFTGALLTYYLSSSSPSFSINSTEGKKVLHNLAQASHCAAQGKVGSGFDIATAVYGTCIYRRFSPSILTSVGEPGTPNFAARVRAVVEDTDSSKWDTEVTKSGVSIPTGTALVMCDVDCGSQTVGMVKQVLAWRQADPAGSKALMDELQTCNTNLAKLLSSDSVSSVGDKEREDFAYAFGEIRKRIREMGARSGVPIEPEEQTELLDAVAKNVEGVLGGVVPGAGGHDAIVLLVKDDAKTTAEIEAFLKRWSEEKKSKVKLLGTRGELEGARAEDIAAYGGR